MKNTLCWRNKFLSVFMIVLSMLFIMGCADFMDDSDDSNPFANTSYSDGKNDDHDHSIKSLTEVAQINNGDAASVICRDNYCYTAGANATNESFNIIDMSDPAAPVTIGRYNIGYGYGIALNGNYAYIQTDGHGAGIFSPGTTGVMNISDPTNPVPVMQNSAGYFSAYQTYYHNGYVYSASSSIIGIYSTVNDPANLVHVRNINAGGVVWLTFSGNYMYGFSAGKFTIWDISDPANPTVTGSLSNSDLANDGGVAIQGNYVFMGSNKKIRVFDISDKTNPILVATLSLTTGTSSELNEAKIIDNYLLIAGRWDFYVVDIANPLSPKEVTSMPLSSYGWGLDILNSQYAIVGDDTLYRVIKLW